MNKILLVCFFILGIAFTFLVIPIEALRVDIPIPTNYTLVNTNNSLTSDYSLDSDKLDGQHGSYYTGYCDTKVGDYWLSNGSSTATGNWNLGNKNLTILGGITLGSINRLTSDGEQIILDYDRLSNLDWVFFRGKNGITTHSSDLILGWYNSFFSFFPGDTVYGNYTLGTDAINQKWLDLWLSRTAHIGNSWLNDTGLYTTGNVTANKFKGDGSLLTGISSNVNGTNLNVLNVNSTSQTINGNLTVTGTSNLKGGITIGDSITGVQPLIIIDSNMNPKPYLEYDNNFMQSGYAGGSWVSANGSSAWASRSDTSTAVLASWSKNLSVETSFLMLNTNDLTDGDGWLITKRGDQDNRLVFEHDNYAIPGDNIEALQVSTTGNVTVAGNVSADYYLGDGSLLTNINGDNSSWNESRANSLYLNRTSESLYTTTYNSTYASLVTDNRSWNESYAYTKFLNKTSESIYLSTYNATYDAKVSDNSSWNESKANTLYYNRTSNLNIDGFNLTTTAQINAARFNGTNATLVSANISNTIINQSGIRTTNISANLLGLGTSPDPLALIKGSISGNGVSGINLSVTNGGFGIEGTGITINGVQSGGPTVTATTLLKLIGSTTSPQLIKGIDMVFTGSGAITPFGITLTTSGSGFTTIFEDNNYTAVGSAITGIGLRNIMRQTSSIAVSADNTGVYTSIFDNGAQGNDNMGEDISIIMNNSAALTDPSRGYGIRTVLNSTSRQRVKMYNFFGQYSSTNKSDEMYGIYLRNIGGIKNDPDNFTVGLYINHTQQGSDNNNKSWSIFVDSLLNSSKVYLGQGNTYWGSNYNNFISGNSSGLSITTTNLSVNGKTGKDTNTIVITSVDFLGSVTTSCSMNFTGGILNTDSTC